MEYQRDEHRVHLMVAHLVWTPKRRKAAIAGAIAADGRRVIEAKCNEPGRQMMERSIQPDHIHLVLRVWPSESAADIVNAGKGITSRARRKNDPSLLKLPSLWTSSSFAATAGNVSSETVKRSIAAQQGL